MIFLLFVGAATAASISSTTITNTNVYSADSNTQYNIAPSGYYDSGSTATGMAHVSGRYLYASGLSASPNPADVSQTVTFTVQGQQGAAILEGTEKATSGYAVTYGDGSTGSTLTHKYTDWGSKSASIKLTNPANTAGVTVSTTVTINHPPTISGTTVTNTNVYSTDSATQYNLAPPGYADGTSTSSGVTHVSGRFIYATGLTASPNPAEVNEEVTFTIQGQQGAAIKEGTAKADSGYMFTYESGVTANDFKHTYTIPGSKAASVKLVNDGYSAGVTVSTSVTVVAVNPEISAVTLTTPTPASISTPITASVSATSPSSSTLNYQWYYSTNGGSTWSAISGQTSSALSFTASAAGTYVLKVVVTDSGGSTDSYEAGFTSVVVKALSNPTFTQQPVFSAAQGTLTAQPSMSFVANANVLGDTSVHIHSNTVQVSGTGGTWQEATTNTFVGGVWTLVKPIHYSDTAGTTHTYTTTVTTFVGESWSDPNKRIIGEVTSQPFSFTTYAAPVFTSLTVPTAINIPGTITFSATATDALSIIYQISTNQASWTEITSPHSITETGTYYFRAYATGYGGSTYSQIVTITASDVIPAFTSASVTPAAGIIPFDVTFTASATNNPTYTWYETTSGSLVEIGRGQTIRHTLNAQSAIGVHKFICVAENQYGDATSNELTVTAGVLPDTRIVTPAAGDSFTENTAVTFRASAAHGPATYVWTFPDGTTAEGETVTHTFTTRGSATVTVTGTNQYGSDTARVGIFIEKFYPGNRPKATGTLAVPDTQLYEDTLGYATSFNGDLENLNGLRETFEKPFTGVLGSALFYIILFGVPAFLIWFATGSAKIPAIIGIIASGFIMVFFPDEWGSNIFILIITIIATGVIWIFVKRE